MAGEGLYQLRQTYPAHMFPSPDPDAVQVHIYLLADSDSAPVATIGGPEAANVWDHAQSLRDAGQRDAFIYGVLMGVRFVDLTNEIAPDVAPDRMPSLSPHLVRVPGRAIKKEPHVLLGLQALAFSMKGASVTAAERHALREAAARVPTQRAGGEWANIETLKGVALRAADTNPLTDEICGELRAALDLFSLRDAATGRSRYFWEEGQYR